MARTVQRGPRDSLALAMRAAAEAVRLSELGGEALASLKRAVGATSALVYRYSERGELEVFGGDLADVIPFYSPDMACTDPLQQEPRRMPSGAKVVTVTEIVERKALVRSAAYNEFYRPYDVEHVMCTWIVDDLPYGAPGMAGMFFARSRHKPRFSADEAAMVRRALPALTAAAHRCGRIEAEDRERRALDGALALAVQKPTLVLDTAGRTRWVSEAAERLLGRGLSHDGALPDELTASARRLGAFSVAPDASLPIEFHVDVALPTGASLGAELSLARSAGGETLVLVQLAGPKARSMDSRRFDALVARHKLTPTEAQTLRDLAEGLSNPAIATRRRVSIETIRTHVARTLAKLDLPSRVQAALIARDALDEHEG